MYQKRLEANKVNVFKKKTFKISSKSCVFVQAFNSDVSLPG